MTECLNEFMWVPFTIEQPKFITVSQPHRHQLSLTQSLMPIYFDGTEVSEKLKMKTEVKDVCTSGIPPSPNHICFSTEGNISHKDMQKCSEVPVYLILTACFIKSHIPYTACIYASIFIPITAASSVLTSYLIWDGLCS